MAPKTMVESAVQGPRQTLEDLRRELVGIDEKVPLLDGSHITYVNFDNAASTPTFKSIVAKVDDFLRWYSNVHRGTGFKSQLSSWVFEKSRDKVAKFVGVDPIRDVVIFCKNSTEAINKLSHRLPLKKEDVILTSLMEHHSNELPWRPKGKVQHIGLTPDGNLDLEHLKCLLNRFGEQIKLVAICGASNVTGYINPIHEIARLTHRAGAKIVVDAAQLAPHRPINMNPGDPEEKIDFLVFSAHKMYAPYGVGVLVGPRETFEQGDPDVVGGGMVDIVTLEEAYWTDLPDKEEAGTPDLVGVVALAAAIKLFEQLGWEKLIEHEAELTRYALTQLNQIPEVEVFGNPETFDPRHRMGVISFNLKNLPHALLAAILNFEYGIGVRSGCFCAHTYVKNLLHLSDDDSKEVEQMILSRDRSQIPGAMRVSFGIYNNKSEVDRLIRAIKQIVAGEYQGKYELDRMRGEYFPENFTVEFEKYFSI